MRQDMHVDVLKCYRLARCTCYTTATASLVSISTVCSHTPASRGAAAVRPLASRPMRAEPAAMSAGSRERRHRAQRAKAHANGSGHAAMPKVAAATANELRKPTASTTKPHPKVAPS
mmetsp:Transcript_1989/g.5998  ORF Transcript_1989/g.5998 Transcript_1989/m.5998 type:complete len:117 (+) Transcript_1989:1635-1985(+)